MPEEPEIKADEDWKSRVKAENEQLDAQRQRESAGGADRPVREAEAGRERPRLPKPDFTTLVGMFSTQAMVAMGLIPNPSGEEVDVQIDLARHFIDLLAVLEEKTQGQLNDVEHRLLDQSLHELRMAFVEVSRGA